MKKAVLFLILSIFYSGVYAQTSPAKPDSVKSRSNGLEASFGYSIPLGMYSSSDRQNEKSGYAMGGWQAQLTYDWMGKKDFGLAVQYVYQRNPMQHAANLLYQYPSEIPDSLGSRWSNNYVLMGPVFMKTIKRLHLDAKILGGVIVSSSAIFNTPDPTDSTGGRYNKNIATGFGYQLSFGVGYLVTSHLALKLNISLLGGWPSKNRQYPSQLIGYVEYKDPITGIKYTKPIYSAPMEFDIHKVVATFNPSIGILYKF